VDPLSASATAAEIVFDRATKRYPGRPQPAVTELSLTIPAGEICVLVGPSGGGKTTAMKMVNRLISITEGDITIDGTSVRSLDLTELRRGIGYVIQQVGLFPHLSVGDNIGTVPKLLGWPKKQIRDRAVELLELVGLEAADAKRYPAQLSGGQRQRVGLARALAANPPLMLMDEPFGAIDPIVRARLQDEFLRLQGELRKTVVFVTHDIDEAVLVGDRICLLKMQAEIAQYDTPERILIKPASDYVAEFLGRERLVRRMAIAHISLPSLERSASPRAEEPHIALTASLTDAFAAALASPTERAAVYDGDRYVGAFTAASLLESLRREGSEGGQQVAAGV